MVEKPMIVVKDASDFIMHVFDLRNQSPYDYFVRIHLDDGKEYLKLSANLIGWGKKDKKTRTKLGRSKKMLYFSHCP